MAIAGRLARLLDSLCVWLGFGQPLRHYDSKKSLWWWFSRLILLQPHLLLHDGTYCKRWYLLPRNRWINVYVHRFAGPDPDPDLHCHPWPCVSVILWNGYVEKRLDPLVREAVALDSDRVWHLPVQLIARRPGAVVFRRGASPHTIAHLLGKTCWTLFITGPTVRLWGFHRRSGWQPYVPNAEPKALL